MRATTTPVLLAFGLLLVALPPSSQAKGVEWVKVCGPSDCTKTPGRELDFEQSPLIFPPWVMSGRPDPPPREAAPWLRVRVAYARSERRVSSVVVPRLGYAGGDQDGHYGFVWQRLSPAEQRTYKRLGRGLERFPAETLPGLPESRAGPAKRPRGVVEQCSTRSEANFPGGFTARRNLVVGPLALTGAGQMPTAPSKRSGRLGRRPSGRDVQGLSARRVLRQQCRRAPRHLLVRGRARRVAPLRAAPHMGR